MLIKNNSEKIGSMFALLSGLMLGLFPVFVNRGVQNIPPLFFAGASTSLAAWGALVYSAKQKSFFEFKNKKAYPSLLMVALFIVIIPYLLFFIGASKTSGVNTAVLLLSEIIFTTIFTHFIGEKTTMNKIVGASGIFFGAFLIVYRGVSEINTGDILIVLSTLSFPIGNFYSKKTLNLVSPPTILLFRFTLSGLFFIILSILFEGFLWSGDVLNVVSHNMFFILFNGLIILGIGKIVWYEALKRLDISKAISLEMTFPLFSLLTLVLFFGEKISGLQWLGISAMLVGVFFSCRRQSVDPNLTSYCMVCERD